MKLLFKLEIHDLPRANHKYAVCIKLPPGRGNSFRVGDIAEADTKKPLHPPGCWAWLKYKKVD